VPTRSQPAENTRPEMGLFASPALCRAMAQQMHNSGAEPAREKKSGLIPSLDSAAKESGRAPGA